MCMGQIQFWSRILISTFCFNFTIVISPNFLHEYFISSCENQVFKKTYDERLLWPNYKWIVSFKKFELVTRIILQNGFQTIAYKEQSINKVRFQWYRSFLFTCRCKNIKTFDKSELNHDEFRQISRWVYTKSIFYLSY